MAFKIDPKQKHPESLPGCFCFGSILSAIWHPNGLAWIVGLLVVFFFEIKKIISRRSRSNQNTHLWGSKDEVQEEHEMEVDEE